MNFTSYNVLVSEIPPKLVLFRVPSRDAWTLRGVSFGKGGDSQYKMYEHHLIVAEATFQYRSNINLPKDWLRANARRLQHVPSTSCVTIVDRLTC